MELFKDWILRLEKTGSSVQTEFSGMNPRQLNWKASENKWSIAQCLDHIIVSDEKYFPLLDKLASGKYVMTFWEKINPLSSYTGRKMVETLGIKVIKPFVSPKLFEPGKSNIRTSIVQDFLMHQEKLKSKISRLKTFDPDKFIVSSPVAPLLTFKLKDCLEILVGHEERHLQQARNVKGSDNFPEI